jgi:PKD repeat protein
MILLLAVIVGCAQPPAPVQKPASIATPVSIPPPAVDFTSSIREGQAPLAVSFTALTTGEVNRWQWDFGDGQFSDMSSPTHIYASTGEYAVSLMVTGPSGSGTKTKSAHIRVTRDIISWKEAANYIGQNKAVEGTIVGANYAAATKGKPTFLNFNIPYRGYFSCVIWDSDRAKFINQFQANPEIYLLNKRVVIRGLIEEYPKGSGIPEIVLTEPSQIEIIEK